MPPKFSLQSVLDYQHNRVEQLQVNLSQLETARKLLEDARDATRIEQQSMYDKLVEFQSGEIDLPAVLQTRYNIKRLSERIEKLEAEMAVYDGKIKKARAELIQARQDEAVMEKLKSKELERYFEKQVEQDKRLQDDINTSKTNLEIMRQFRDEEVSV
jgi:flagellar export protein FliJ